MPDRPDPARLLTLSILACVDTLTDRGPGFLRAVELVRCGLESERDAGRTEGVGVMIPSCEGDPCRAAVVATDAG